MGYHLIFYGLPVLVPSHEAVIPHCSKLNAVRFWHRVSICSRHCLSGSQEILAADLSSVCGFSVSHDAFIERQWSRTIAVAL